jgi:DNA-binding LytR/AlgR family response regulator
MSSKQKGMLRANDMVLLESGKSGHFRHVRDILCIQSEGKHTHVFCAQQGRYIVRRSLRDWEKVLPKDLFVQLDRGLLINRAQIQGADFEGRGATLKLGHEQHSVPLGRRAATQLRCLLSDVP